MQDRKLKELGPILFRGFTKKENGHWISVCVDLNIIAQGSTSKESEKRVIDMIMEYLDYVCCEYPDEIHKFLNRPVPPEIISDYEHIVGQFLKRRKKTRNRSLFYPQISLSEIGASCA